VFAAAADLRLRADITASNFDNIDVCQFSGAGACCAGLFRQFEREVISERRRDMAVGTAVPTEQNAKIEAQPLIGWAVGRLQQPERINLTRQ
jgi:hypothetical protein